MENFNLSFPIDMIKKEERIVSGIATADNIDKANDIVDFNASLEAFKNWGGNIREMHAPIAVGKAINYEPVKIKGSDGKEYNAIRVDAYISKGAQNTWEKILDGTLRAFSIGGKIIEKADMADKMHNGRSIKLIKKYVLGELSLVDNPANALATVDIVKMDSDGGLNYVLQNVLDEIEKAKKQPLKDPKGGLTAAGRRHFKETEGANLKPGVKGKADTPEKMRRKGSFLTRFFTNPSGPMKDEKGRPTRLALSAAAWGEPVPQNMQDAAALAAKGRRLLERYQATKKMDSIEMEKEGEVTTGGMDAGIKNPTQGSFKTPSMPSKKKKEKKMKKSVEANQPLIDALQGTLANAVVLYFSAHRAHWNVQGPDFSEYHELFGEIYEDIYSSVDPFAENIRKVGGFPQTLSEMEDASSFEDASDTTDARLLAVDLYNKNDQYIEMLKEAFNVANSQNEQGVANFIAERIDSHRKWGWQLNASLGGVETIEVETEEEEGESEDDSASPMDQLMNLLNEAMGADVEKAAPTKREAGEDFPAAAFAYVPDPSKPSTWKLRLWESNESKITSAQVGRAVAALGAGFRGNKVSIPSEDLPKVKAKVMAAWKSANKDKKSSEVPSVLKYEEDIDLIKMQDSLLQNDIKYDNVLNMNEQENEKLSLIKRVVNWLVPDVEENASTEVEVTDNTQEENMDIEILKDALSAVVDEKLATFATSIKEEVEASLQEKIDNITKGFEANTTSLQEKLEATEKALAEQEEQVKAFADAGAIKKSVDPEDGDDDEEISKSAPKSVWDNVYLPQNLIKALGYES